MENFYIHREIIIEIEEPHSEITLRMRPLKIKELSLYFSAIDKSKKEETIHPELISLLKRTIDKNIEELPITILPDLLAELFNLSFPKDAKGKKENEIEFVEMLDFLMSQGHLYSEILEYTCPQFRQFLEAATNRILGKKKKKSKNPIGLLTSLGIPIKIGVKNNGG